MLDSPSVSPWRTRISFGLIAPKRKRPPGGRRIQGYADSSPNSIPFDSELGAWVKPTNQLSGSSLLLIRLTLRTSRVLTAQVRAVPVKMAVQIRAQGRQPQVRRAFPCRLATAST